MRESRAIQSGTPQNRLENIWAALNCWLRRGPCHFTASFEKLDNVGFSFTSRINFYWSLRSVGYFLRSFRISRAAFRPGRPVTPPPGCVPAPQR